MGTIFYAEHSNHGGFHPDWRKQWLTKSECQNHVLSRWKIRAWYNFHSALQAHTALNCAVALLPEKRDAVSCLHLCSRAAYSLLSGISFTEKGSYAYKFLP